MGAVVYDAVLIGAGHNALTAGILLTKAGWRVGIFERGQDVGGAIRTAEWTLPGYRHDALANTHVFILISPFYRQMRAELEKYGLKYLRFPVPLASVFPDGDAVCMHRDLEQTLGSLGKQSAADADGWRFLYDLYKRYQETFVALFSSPLPSVRALAGLIRPRLGLGPRGTVEFAQMLIMSAGDFAGRHFSTAKARAWFVPWALHPDHSPETAGGGALSWIVLGTSQDPGAGLAIPEGGSGALTAALASLLRSLGGEIHLGQEVVRILLRGRTAQGVELAGGTRVKANRAVVAGLAPTKLFLDLVGEGHLPGAFLELVRRYRYGLSVVKIDYALDRAPAWIAGDEVGRAGNLHLASGVDSMSHAHNQALRGYLPDEPLLIVSQPTVLDPTRAPPGKHTLWVVVRSVPHLVKGDSRGEIQPGPWDRIKDRFADRVTGLLEGYAPGFRASVLGRCVLSPDDLERLNPNLVRGDVAAGSMLLDQSYLFRPFPGWSRGQTPIRRLYLTGAATHPGLGISTNPGYITARLLLR